MKVKRQTRRSPECDIPAFEPPAGSSGTATGAAPFSPLEKDIAACAAELEAKRSALREASERLEENRRFVESIADACPDILYVYDLRERCSLYVNRQAREILGYSPSECVRMGAAILDRLFEEEGKRRYEQWLAKVRNAADGEVIETEFRLRRADGAWRDFRNRIVVYQRGPDGAPSQVAGVARDITARKRSERALEASRAALRETTRKLRALAARTLAAAEEERRRIARELHDDMNQRLAMLAVDLGVQARQLPPSSALLKGYLRKVQGRVARLSEDLRRMAHNLHPTMLDDLGLKVALQSYSEEFSRVEGIAVKVEFAKVPPSIPPEIALCLFRIAQECLANIARHSRSDHARIRLEGGGGGLLSLRVADAGVGFDPDSKALHGGLGLASIRERVRLLGGKMSIRSAPGAGATIDIAVRLPEKGSKRAKATSAAG